MTITSSLLASYFLQMTGQKGFIQLLAVYVHQQQLGKELNVKLLNVVLCGCI